MSFYFDPGYGKLMELYSNTTNAKLEYVENSTYNPTSGVAFTYTSGSWSFFPNFDFTFEPTAGQFYKKVWSLKLSVYTPGSGGFRAGFSTVASGAPIHGGVQITSNSYNINRYVEGTQLSAYTSGFSAGLHNISITLALTADGTGSGITYIRTTTIDVDGVVDFQTYAMTTLPSYLPQYALIYFGGGSNHYYVSNVLVGQASYEGDGTDDIPSDDGIPANTPIYRLPLDDPITNGFELNEDGEYVAKTNGSTLLQTVDTTDLITAHGDQSINHIVTYGNPGYRVGGAVSAATGISKSGNIITPHGSCELSFDKTAHIYKAWAIDNGSSFSSINGLQVGWQAGD